MPIYPPRSEPAKKQEELAKREVALKLGLSKSISPEKLTKLIENYRKAQLSLLKAKIHQMRERRIQGKASEADFKKLEQMVVDWYTLDREQILNQFI
jgi:hypothetical protein